MITIDKGDPLREIVSVFSGKCEKCHKPFVKGERIWWRKLGNPKVLHLQCGKAAQTFFNADTFPSPPGTKKRPPVVSEEAAPPPKKKKRRRKLFDDLK